MRPSLSISTAATEASTQRIRVVNGKARLSSMTVKNPLACSSSAQLDELIEEATIDCYDEAVAVALPRARAQSDACE
jgi:hypothetical protein